ncbi:hypothetical protein HMPREF1137_1987 [Actinomyces sp. ICM39]|nr:hypothetical protein HMPREF1137_1987 [Actinomyces sp. ICM39]
MPRPGARHQRRRHAHRIHGERRDHSQKRHTHGPHCARRGHGVQERYEARTARPMRPTLAVAPLTPQRETTTAPATHTPDYRRTNNTLYPRYIGLLDRRSVDL